MHTRGKNIIPELIPSELVLTVVVKFLEDVKQLALLLLVYQTSLELYH